MKNLVMFLSLMLISAATFANHHGEMKEHRKALLETCKTETETFCKDVPKGKGRIIKCLKEKSSEATFGAECKTSLEALAAEHKERKEAKK